MFKYIYLNNYNALSTENYANLIIKNLSYQVTNIVFKKILIVFFSKI